MYTLYEIWDMSTGNYLETVDSLHEAYAVVAEYDSFKDGTIARIKGIAYKDDGTHTWLSVVLQ